MKYANYIDIPDWELLRDKIIAFREKQPHKDILWWCYFADEIKKEIPELISTFESMGLDMRQMILFTTPHNDLDQADSTHPEAVFIHTDREDNPESRYDKKPVLTDFETSCAINIPLINCAGSTTLFYKLLNDNDDVYYQVTDCGGHAKSDVEEVFRFELTKPAVLKINVPHAVYNPHKDVRVVATFRFYNNLDYLFKD
jgi:hypothetical protein